MDILNRLAQDLRQAGRIAFFNSNKTELQVRCCYCGDSKEKSHAHLYITNRAPFAFFCQRCETSGILNDGFLDDMSVDDGDLSQEVRIVQRTHRKDSNNRAAHRGAILPADIRFPKYGKDFDWKLDYMEERLGGRILRSDLMRYRVVANLEDYLVLNGMEHLLDRDEFFRDCRFVDKNGVGWLSRDGTHATFRMIGDFKRRFKTIRLIDDDEASKTFVLKSTVERMAPRIELVQAEGFFDIVSVYRNFYADKDNLNRVFCAVNGKGFNQFPHFLQRKFGFINLDLTIYADSDQSVEHYRHILQLHRYRRVQVVYNVAEGQKDFGVRPDQIEAKRRYIKK